MVPLKYDVAVIGAGTMGSAAAYFLAQRGLKTIAFEQFGIAHELGSHSGATRIIRFAYHESADYVPLVLRSYDLWHELEKQTGKHLLVPTGGIYLGPRERSAVDHALLACRMHSLPYEHLNADEVSTRWPQFKIPPEWHACYDPQMAFLLVDDCIRSYATAAIAAGAEVQEHEPVLGYQSAGNSILITTQKRSYEVSKMVICAGSWSSRLLAELNLPLRVQRKTLVWLEARQPENFRIGEFPIFLADTGSGFFYGFPIFGRAGIKIANHTSSGVETSPDKVDRVFHEEDASDVKRFAAEYLHGLNSNVLEGKVCLYTLTPDEDFIIDLHPGNRNMAIAAGFSGHGFKFAPVVGEILADLIVSGVTKHSISRFQISRFVNR